MRAAFHSHTRNMAKAKMLAIRQPRTGPDTHENDVPPQFRGRMSRTVAATVRTAPP